MRSLKCTIVAYFVIIVFHQPTQAAYEKIKKEVFLTNSSKIQYTIHFNVRSPRSVRINNCLTYYQIADLTL